MTDAQNERTNAGRRHRGRKNQRGGPDRRQVADRVPAVEPGAPVLPAQEPPPGERATPPMEAAFVRPANLSPPTERMDVYCVHHMALLPEHEPFTTRTNMTTLRHLAVDRFGEATLFCDCLHNGPHEWPATLQKLETAIELDQFVTASTSEA